jgi:Sulfotransferase domain
VLAAYRRRTKEVCAAIPAERLLVFDVAEGWSPLCRFLDVPVPDAPFPRLNSTEQFWKMVRGEPSTPSSCRRPPMLTSPLSDQAFRPK